MSDSPPPRSTEPEDDGFVNKHLLALGFSIIFLGVIAVVTAPYLLTQFSFGFNLSDTGQIGDSIAGTTAPIVGVIGSVLVFLSLYAQIQANRLVLSEFKRDRERYESESREREVDRKTEILRFREGQQNQNFRTLVDLVGDQRKELGALSAYDSDKRVLVGLSAAYQILRRQFNTGSDSDFPLLESIVKDVQNLINLSNVLDLKTEQRAMIGTQTLGVLGKLDVLLTTRFEASRIPASSIASFAAELSAAMGAAISLRDQGTSITRIS